MNNEIEKNREYQSKWYNSNKTKHFDRVKQREIKIKQLLQEYKSTLSCKCGESHISCIDFHHTDPKTKITSIAHAVGRGWGWKKILSEIEKCTVMCSNCHRKFHWQEEQSKNILV